MWQCHVSSSECRCYRLNGFSLLKRFPLSADGACGKALDQPVGEWLEHVGLPQYESKFLLNGFDDLRFMVSHLPHVIPHGVASPLHHSCLWMPAMARPLWSFDVTTLLTCPLLVSQLLFPLFFFFFSSSLSLLHLFAFYSSSSPQQCLMTQLRFMVSHTERLSRIWPVTTGKTNGSQKPLHFFSPTIPLTLSNLPNNSEKLLPH